MAVADVILRIGFKFGPGGLASLQAGLTMVKQLEIPTDTRPHNHCLNLKEDEEITFTDEELNGCC